MTTANDALLDSWHLSLHDKSPGTRQLYLAEVRRFAQTAGDLVGVTHRDAERWVHAQQTAGLSRSTIRSRWIALRSFYRWAALEGEVDESPFARVVVPRADPPPPQVLTSDELAALLKVCEGQGFNERRDSAIIRTLLATGLRVSELCGLTIDDVDLRLRVALVRHGKGDRSRVVRFDPRTAAAIDRYKRARARHRCAELPWLWIGWRGRITRKGVPAILDKRSAEAGIRHVNAHAFRHTWAHRWLAAGGTEGDLQQLGGWEGEEVMRRYGSALAVDRALAAYDNVNPAGDL